MTAREIIDLFLALKSRGAMIATVEKASLISRATLSLSLADHKCREINGKAGCNNSTCRGRNPDCGRSSNVSLL